MCITIDNVFMMVIVWFANYIKVSGFLRYTDRIVSKNCDLFLQMFNKSTIYWYEANLLLFNYSDRIAKKLEMAIGVSVKTLASRLQPIHVDKDVTKILLIYGHRYFCVALGLVLVSRHARLPPDEWSRKFIYAIQDFEKKNSSC